MKAGSGRPRLADFFSGENALLDAQIAIVLIVLGVAAIVATLRYSGDVPERMVIPVTMVVVLLSVGYGLLAWNKPEKAIRGTIAVPLAVFVISAGRAFLEGPAAGGYGRVVGAIVQTGPTVLVLYIPALTTIWIVSLVRRHRLQRSLDEALREREREAAARQVAEARASLLQLQIQPHFLFNTLAALRQWVDTNDPRAAPLLGNLTGFLRDSTDLLGRADVPLGDECTMVRHYLEIMQARLGARLTFSVDVDPACVAVSLPPGIVITLVENAIRHGIEPSLHGGNVTLEARCQQGKLDLHVRDTGIGLGPDRRPGVGLSNCIERLQHRFKDAASLTVAPRTDGPGVDARLQIGPAATIVHAGIDHSVPAAP